MKRTGSSRVRIKIIALLVALTALWAFAAVVTVRDGLNVLFVTTLTNNVGVPTESLMDALQQERRLSVIAVSGGATATPQLESSRERTDRELAAWQESVESTSLGVAASRRLKDRLAEAATQFDGLAELRASVTDRSAGRVEVLVGFTEMIDAGFNIYGAITVIDDQDIAQQSRALVSLSRGREVLSQQDALLAGVLAEGRFSESDLTEVTQLIGTQRFVYQTTTIDLQPEDQVLYDQLVDSPAFSELRRLEDQILTQARPGRAAPISADAWQETIEPAMAAIRGMELAAADNVVERATPAAAGVVVRLLLAGGLGLIAVIAAVVISVTTARALVRQLERLRDAAWDLARHRLPRVVDRLSAGEQVDVAAEAPPLRFGDDEIGQVGQAFNAVQETAVKAAVQQAELRRGVRDVFLSLARRTQNLVHKQLTVVDGMERRETDADEMEELYRIDHLATRMRRNAENLIVLSGASPGRTWRQPVAMIDVIRGAVAEVEDYTRVSLLPVDAGSLDGRAVGDVIHLLAELIENAASYSPPYAKVGVSGQRVAHGFVVEVEDRGLGMTEEELTAANAKLANPPDFSLADASRLGHYVVAKLSHRHGVRVHLRPSPYGGVVAIVLVPLSLLADGSSPTGAGAHAISAPVITGDPSQLSADHGAASTFDPGAFDSGALDATALDPGALDRDTSGGSDPAAGVSVARQRPAASSYSGSPLESVPDSALDPFLQSGTASRPDQDPGREADSQTGPGAGLGAWPELPAGILPAPPETGHEPRHGLEPTPPDRAVDTLATPNSPTPEPPRTTPSGLPWRVRQASLPRQMWDAEAAETRRPSPASNGAHPGGEGPGGFAGFGDHDEDDPAPRDPEQVRRMMRSYQHGTQRGRQGDEAPPPEPPEPTDRQEG